MLSPSGNGASASCAPRRMPWPKPFAGMTRLAFFHRRAPRPPITTRRELEPGTGIRSPSAKSGVVDPQQADRLAPLLCPGPMRSSIPAAPTPPSTLAAWEQRMRTELLPTATGLTMISTHLAFPSFTWDPCPFTREISFRADSGIFINRAQPEGGPDNLLSGFAQRTGCPGHPAEHELPPPAVASPHSFPFSFFRFGFMPTLPTPTSMPPTAPTPRATTTNRPGCSSNSSPRAAIRPRSASTSPTPTRARVTPARPSSTTSAPAISRRATATSTKTCNSPARPPGSIRIPSAGGRSSCSASTGRCGSESWRLSLLLIFGAVIGSAYTPACSRVSAIPPRLLKTIFRAILFAGIPFCLLMGYVETLHHRIQRPDRRCHRRAEVSHAAPVALRKFRHHRQRSPRANSSRLRASTITTSGSRPATTTSAGSRKKISSPSSPGASTLSRRIKIVSTSGSCLL